MAIDVVAGSPLAESLTAAVGSKLTELGWSSGASDDSALSEFIILMLVNGKTQSEMTSELANDLLVLNPDDPGAGEFAEWLFKELEATNTRLNGGSMSQQMSVAAQDQTMAVDESSQSGVMDAAMSDGADGPTDGTIPTGPKSMRNGGNGQRTRDRRMLGQMSKAMDRGNEASLHRIKGAAGRVNQHSRDAPRGPRGTLNRSQHMMGGRGASMAGMAGMAGLNPALANNTNPQQQMHILQLLEEQSRMMAQILGPGANAPAINPAFFAGGAQQPSANAGKSLFERVENRGVRGNGHFKTRKPQHTSKGDAMETDAPSMNGEHEEKKPLGEVPCRFQLSCNTTTCPFAHQSPAAPPGTSIDTTDKCSFGAACTNRKCTGVHPSPAQKRQHLSNAVDCKFYPNCTNPSCPFKHPTTPPCRNGADCPEKDSGCTYSHSTIACRFNPCLNPGCVFKHAEGQKRGKFEDKVWTAEGFDRSSAEKLQNGGHHVSERKFVNGDAEEELILPGNAGAEVEMGGGETEGQSQGQSQEIGTSEADIVT